MMILILVISILLIVFGFLGMKTPQDNAPTHAFAHSEATKNTDNNQESPRTEKHFTLMYKSGVFLLRVFIVVVIIVTLITGT